MARFFIYGALMILWLILSACSLLQGEAHISVQQIIYFLLHFNAPASLQSTIFWQLRLPRVVVLSAVGASLGLGGVLMQGLFRNPLADPGLLGVSSGSALAVVLALATGASFFGATVASLLGALLIMLLLCVFSILLRTSSSLLLAGVASGVLCAAATSMVLYLANNSKIAMIIHWSLGGVMLVSWSELAFCSLIWVIAVILCYRQSRALDVWGLDQDSALSLGVSMKRLQVACVVTVALIAAVAVNLVGPVAFVGLIIPHMGRAIVGPLHKKLMHVSILLGASLLLVADLFCRAIHPPEVLPLGVASALIGAPLFIGLLIYATSRKHWR